MMRANNGLTIINGVLPRFLGTDSRRSCLLLAWSISEFYHIQSKSRIYLLVRHFGKEIIANAAQLPLNDERVTTLWQKIYEVRIPCPHPLPSILIPHMTQEFIEAIDAIDNGISQYPTSIVPKYRNRTDLSSRVGHLNPAWNHPFDNVTLDVCAFPPMCKYELIYYVVLG
jgi:uncharacterized UPF0160 family protein